jgi:hypothetical protein
MNMPTYEPEGSWLLNRLMDTIKKKMIRADTLARILPRRETGL